MSQDKTETKSESKNQTKSKSWKKVVGIAAAVIMTIGTLLGYQSWKMQQDMESRRAAMQAQREAVVRYWQDQGLTEAEIQQKLEEDRSERFDGGEQPFYWSVVRSVRHATGTGPGVGR